MQGLHPTADFHHCRCAPEWLLDARQLGSACLQAVRACGLNLVQRLFYTFPSAPLGAGGMTAAILPAKSSVCMHTWSEQSAVTLPVHACNAGAGHAAPACALMGAPLSLLNPVDGTRPALQRSEVAPVATERTTL